MLRWNKADIPHKGWEYIGMEDLGEDVYPGDPIPYEQCEMCGKEKIRYVHLLKHPDYDGEIRVGCDCASKMVCDYVTPQERERNLKNRVNRRKNFMKQENMRCIKQNVLEKTRNWKLYTALQRRLHHYYEEQIRSRLGYHL